jgi:aryl-alcohol dehydrogenase-like predicted oxidoreductase
VSPHAVALAWIIAQGSTVIPIPASRRLSHALDSLSAANLELDRDELAAIDQASFSREYSLRRRLRGLLGHTVKRVIGRTGR